MAIETTRSTAGQPDTTTAWNTIAAGYDAFVTSSHLWLAGEGLQRADLRPGMRFLDVAAGSGALSIPAARRGATVLSTDLSPVMLERLAVRAQRENLVIDTAVMNGEALELESDAFDVVGSQFGVMLFPHMPTGIREMARVTKPGGRVLVTAYGAPAKIDFLSFFTRAVQTARPEFHGPAALAPPPLPFQLQDPTRLTRELTHVGLTHVVVDTLIETLEFGSGKDLWNWLTNSNPIVRAVLSELELTADEQRRVRGALDCLVEDRAGGRPTASLSNPINVGIGTK